MPKHSNKIKFKIIFDQMFNSKNYLNGTLKLLVKNLIFKFKHELIGDYRSFHIDEYITPAEMQKKTLCSDCIHNLSVHPLSSFTRFN